MKVLMVGVDKTSVGGMLTVINNYLNNKEFCKQTHLKYIPTVIRANKLVKIITFIKKIPLIKRTIKKDSIDIVHVHMAERGSVFREGYVIHLAKKMGCKTVIHMHGAKIEDWYNNQGKFVQKIVRNIFNSADCMLVLGERWKPFMVSVMGEENEAKIKVLHNAVKVPNTNLYNPNAKNILFYGMLINRKGIDDLLKSFKDIMFQLPTDVNLVLYGDDHDSSEKIQDKIHRFDLEKRVKYQGWLTSKNREKVFKNTMINVLPSYNEGLPMTILESMSYGIPNVSSNIVAIPEAIKNGVNGYLITPGDTQDLENKMLYLVKHGDVRRKISNEAYETVKKEFSLQNHFKKLIAIYESIIK